MKMESLSFRDIFDILLEKRLSDVAGLRYIMVYGKCQIITKLACKHMPHSPITNFLSYWLLFFAKN